jgi:type IV fimbrial biogenesis protein FimT
MPRPRLPRTPARGLTLLELMIALAMVAVLMGVAVPSLSAMLARHRLRSAAEHLAMDLGETRHEAVRLGRPLHVSFQTGNRWCYAVSTSPQADCRAGDAAVLKLVTHQDHPGVSLLQAATQSFDAMQGLSPIAAGPILLAAPTGEQLRVQVSRLGRPAVCAPELPMPAVRPCAPS